MLQAGRWGAAARRWLVSLVSGEDPSAHCGTGACQLAVGAGRPRSGGSGPPVAGVRTQPGRTGCRPAALEAVPGRLHPLLRRDPLAGGGARLHCRRLPARRGDGGARLGGPCGDPGQRRVLVLAGAPDRAGVGGPAQPAARPGGGPARGPGAVRACARGRTRRRGVPGGGGRSPGRLPPDRGLRGAGRRCHGHRRVRPAGAPRGRQRRGRAARGSQSATGRYLAGVRGGSRRGLRHRHAHRARTDRPPGPAGCRPGAFALAAGDRSPLAAGRGRRARARPGVIPVRAWRRAAVLGEPAVRHRHHRRQRAGGAPADRDPCPCPGSPAHGRAQRPDPASARGGDSGLDHGHLHRQDRHPDRKPAAAAAAVRGRP